MAGRCYVDPLDAADDVCGICFGNFCEQHLAHTKGRKHPTCLECTLRLSGVRSGGTIAPVGDPKTAKDRRAELKSQTNKEGPTFVYFNEQRSEPMTQSGMGEPSSTRTYEPAQPNPTQPNPAQPNPAEVEPAATPADGETTQDPTNKKPNVVPPLATTAAPSFEPIDQDDGFEDKAFSPQELIRQANLHEEPLYDQLPPVVAEGGTVLDQIVRDKQGRAERLAQEMSERLESTP